MFEVSITIALKFFCYSPLVHIYTWPCDLAAYDSPVGYYVQRLKEGIATIAAAFYPKPVIVRLSIIYFL